MKIIEAVADDEKELEKRVKNNPTYKKIESICKKYGYHLYSAIKYSFGMIIIQIQEPYQTNKYYPQVIFDDDKKGIDAWKIQTTSYGSLKGSEYDKFIKACDNAYKMVQELSKLDFSTLEEIPDEYR